MNAFSLSGVITGSACLGMALCILLGCTLNRQNRLWVAYCCAVAIWGFGGFFIGHAAEPELARIWWRVAYIGVIFIPALFYHYVVTVTGKDRKGIVWTAYLFSAFFLLTNATNGFIPEVRFTFHQFYYLSPPSWIYSCFVVFFFGLVILAQYELWQRLKETSDPSRKARMRWFFIANVISYGGGFTCFLPVYYLDMYPFGNFLVALYPLIISYAILRHHFMDLTVVIERGVVYSVLVACITASYMVAVLVMEHWFQGFFGYRSLVATLAVAFLIALGFNPLRSRIQTLVDRALFHATPVELVAQREQLLGEVRKGEQQKAVATLAAGLAHEIRNPLASIKTFTEYLERQHADPVFRAKFQKIVGGEVERINRIVQQLLEFAKPMPPKLQPLELTRVVEETLELLNNELIQRHVEVKRSYQARPTILGDPQQLKQCLLNLVLNSVQAMNGHGCLTLETRIKGSELILVLGDNGVGIAPEALPHIFDPFFTTKETGTGLGLAVVQGIIREHGGRIAITSRVGQGTVVELSLPLASS